MDGPAEKTKAEGKTPIFGEDVPCPHCGYNLRGLAELRCPECGARYESHELLRQYARCELPPPRLLWMLRHIYLHPLGFWEAPGVRFGQSPSFSCYFTIIGMPPVLTALAVLVFTIVLAMDQGAFGLTVPEVILGLGACVVSFLILMLLVVIHAILCNVVLRPNEGEDPSRRAFSVATYSAAWLTPIVLCVVGAGLSGVYALCLTGVLVSAVLWIATLYKGGLVMSGGRHRAALWCVLANPFWLWPGLAVVGRYFAV